MGGVFYSAVKEKKNETEKDVELLIKTELFAVLKDGYTSIVITPFGCGLDENDPEDMGEIYQYVIEGNFKNAFKKIVFAIPDHVSPYFIDQFKAGFEW